MDKIEKWNYGGNYEKIEINKNVLDKLLEIKTK
jgi:hypothetical protein